MIIVRRKGYGLNLKEKFNTVVYGSKQFRKTNFDNVAVLPWGLTYENKSALVINRKEAIALLSNKPKFRKLLEPSEVRVPKTFYNPVDAIAYLNIENHLPLIGRRRYHFAARNFWVCTSKDYIDMSVRDSCVYWQELLPKDREFRIFVAFGRVWVFMEKLVDDKSQAAWNHSKGARFTILKRSDWLSNACWMALKAQQLSGIDITAFDIILSSGKLYMLEGNTAPAITGPYKQDLFKDIFLWVDQELKNTGKLPEHFPIPPKGTKGWKNYVFEVNI